MRKLILSLFVTVALASLPYETLAGWGTGCGPVGPSNAEAGGRLRARFFGRRQQWIPAEAEQQAEPMVEPQSQVQSEPIGAQTPKQNFGLQLEKMRDPDAKERISINGKEVTPARALEAIEGRRRPRPDPDPDPGPDPAPKPNGIPDDASKLRLTIIGSEAERVPVLTDLNKQPDILLKWVVRDYPPDHWHVAQAGFRTDGHPTIYLQSPDGKVLHRQDDYQGPQDFQAIRKADPNYQQTKDPDMRKSLPGEMFPYAPLVLLAAGVLFLYWKRMQVS